MTVRDTLVTHRGKIIIPAGSNSCAAVLSDTLNPKKVTCSAATLTISGITYTVNAGKEPSLSPSSVTYKDLELPVDTTYVEWTLADGQGASTIKDTIIVQDTQKPVLRRTALMSDITQTTSSGSCTSSNNVIWNDPGSFINFVSPDTLATDNCTSPESLTWHRVDTNQTRVSGSGTVSVGRWAVQYVAKDAAGNASDTIGFRVIVTNNAVPTLTLNNKAIDTVYTALGACTATVPSSFTPAITGLCPGADSLRYACTFNGGAVTEGVGSLEGLDLLVGLYSVTYTASNKFATSGTSPATATFTLAVRDTSEPTIICKDTVIKINVCGYTVVGNAFDPAVTDVCGSYTLVHNYNGGGATLADTVLPIGVHAVTWTLTNASGNTATCSHTITVKDTVPPQFTACPPSVSEITLYSSCTTTAPVRAPKYSDNCAVDSLTWSIRNNVTGSLLDTSANYVYGAVSDTISSTYSFSTGTNVITYVVTDKSGNRAACTFTVPVADYTAPICKSVARQI